MNTPEGWKLVPVEPTPEMQSAAERYAGYHNRVPFSAGYYRAMLAASPTPPEQPVYGSISERAQAGLEAGLWKPEPAAPPWSKPMSVAETWAAGAQLEQPEPGGLTDAQLLDLALKHKLPCAEDIEFRAAQGTAPTYPEQKAWDALRSFTREVLAIARKRPAEEVARIMEAVDKYAKYYRCSAEVTGSVICLSSRAEVERLLKGQV